MQEIRTLVRLSIQLSAVLVILSLLSNRCELFGNDDSTARLTDTASKLKVIASERGEAFFTPNTSQAYPVNFSGSVRGRNACNDCGDHHQTEGKNSVSIHGWPALPASAPYWGYGEALGSLTTDEIHNDRPLSVTQVQAKRR